MQAWVRVCEISVPPREACPEGGRKFGMKLRGVSREVRTSQVALAHAYLYLPKRLRARAGDGETELSRVA